MPSSGPVVVDPSVPTPSGDSPPPTLNPLVIIGGFVAALVLVMLLEYLV
ncbi:MAG: hypothetical protein KC416_10745 [Myxococcales bacterium]|nr:hypothetical protein [Myxococcales bacterium]